MRRRIVVLLVAPIACILLTLGAIIAHSIAVSTAQRAYVDQFGDVTRFLPSAAFALSIGEVSGLQSELDRYGEVYGNGAAVVRRDGSVWLRNAEFTSEAADMGPRLVGALAGRHSAPLGFRWPWDTSPTVVAEPVSSGGDVVAAIVTVSDGSALASRVGWWWLTLAIGVVLAIAAAVFVADRLARWAVRPVRKLALAAAEVGQGRLGARVPPGSGPPELRHLVTAFNDMASRVESAIDHQRAFVANASHELRNPLNALLLQVDAMGLGLPEEAHQHYEAAREEGIRLTRLLDALLMLARGEDSQFVTGPVDLATLARGRVEALTPRAEQRGVRLELVAAEPVWADADDVAVQSALDAVIDNAMKFSDRGADVLVAVGSDGGHAVVSVRGHGPGLNAREMAMATDRFWRSPVHQNKPGSGIGLAIASTFTKVCGGTLALRSPDGGGLMVELRLPASPEDWS